MRRVYPPCSSGAITLHAQISLHVIWLPTFLIIIIIVEASSEKCLSFLGHWIRVLDIGYLKSYSYSSSNSEPIASSFSTLFLFSITSTEKLSTGTTHDLWSDKACDNVFQMPIPTPIHSNAAPPYHFPSCMNARNPIISINWFRRFWPGQMRLLLLSSCKQSLACRPNSERGTCTTQWLRVHLLLQVSTK